MLKRLLKIVQNMKKPFVYSLRVLSTCNKESPVTISVSLQFDPTGYNVNGSYINYYKSETVLMSYKTFVDN